MSRITRIIAAVWEFVVGDDWVTAAGVAAAIGATAILVGADTNAWWLMPVAVVGLLALSLRPRA